MTTESDRITKLDDDTVRKIAAGEVVERPASVVKELVENSLDADAARIDVAVDAGGTERIAVSDDGVGMSEADVRAAVREHTTSKIADVDDLEAGVATLGFRGEALHTIGAVSRTTVTTRPRDADGNERAADRATELRLEGGEVASVGPAGRPTGTTVEVADLFYNTPARRKYLKTTATEFSRVNTVVTRYALANPDVAVSLTHDDREVFATDGRDDLRASMLSVYGREVATSMIAVDGGTFEGEIGVRGHVSDPETTRASREYVSTYVNGRYVRSAALREALLSAYGGQLSTERYPFAVLFVDVPADSVDVNVHPRKMEVRFGDESAVRGAVETAVEDALLDHGLVRSGAPRGRSAPAEARVEPASDVGARDSDDRDASEQTELTPDADVPDRSEQSTLDAGAGAGAEGVGEAGGDEKSDAESVDTDATSAEVATADSRATTGSTNSTTEGTDSGRGSTSAAPNRPESRSEREHATRTASTESETARDRDAVPSSGESDETADSEPNRGRPTDPDTARKFDAPTETATLSGDATETPEFETLPRMRILGQLRDTYLVAETPDGLVLVDQHAADERVNYERLAAAFADDTTTQMLAQPVDLELTAGEAAVFDEYREALETLGFRAERAGQREVTVRTVPTVLDATLDPELLRDALGEFVSTDPDSRGGTVEAVADDLLADLACYPSITGNTSLREGSVVELLAALDDCENPYACPHGRPVLVEFGEREIEDRFERDYPGHAGRRAEE